eukprot:SAG11_NODE_4244_length_1989_cov_3.310582_1_plen_142_part_00
MSPPPMHCSLLSLRAWDGAPAPAGTPSPDAIPLTPPSVEKAGFEYGFTAGAGAGAGGGGGAGAGAMAGTASAKPQGSLAATAVATVAETAGAAGSAGAASALSRFAAAFCATASRFAFEAASCACTCGAAKDDHACLRPSR